MYIIILIQTTKLLQNVRLMQSNAEIFLLFFLFILFFLLILTSMMFKWKNPEWKSKNKPKNPTTTTKKRNLLNTQDSI